MNDLRSEDAWIETLYNDNFDVLYRLVACKLWHYTSSSSDTQDVLQEIFLLAYKNRQLLENHANPTGWLIVTATNVCKNYARAFGRKQRAWQKAAAEWAIYQPHSLPVHYEGAQADDTAASDMQVTLEQALSPEDLGLLTAYCLEGRSIEEICQTTGLAANTVRVRIHRMRKNLSKLLFIFIVTTTAYLNI